MNVRTDRQRYRQTDIQTDKKIHRYHVYVGLAQVCPNYSYIPTYAYNIHIFNLAVPNRSAFVSY